MVPFWFLTIFVAVPLVVLLAAIASPPVLIAGILLAALVVINPGHVGDRVQKWAIWQRLPLIRTQTTAAGFAVALLLYTVPVPGLLTHALVAASQSTGPSQSGTTSPSSSPSSSPTTVPALAESSPTHPPTSTAPTVTPTPTAVAALPPTQTARPAPPRPPAATCSASVKFPTPGDGGDQTVYISSTVPNSPVTIVAHYKTTDHTFTAATDGGGSASVTFSIGRPTIGYQVNVDVTVGNAHCSTSFTPQ